MHHACSVLNTCQMFGFMLKQADEESREHDIMSLFFLVRSYALIATGPLENHDRVTRRQLHHTVSKWLQPP